MATNKQPGNVLVGVAILAARTKLKAWLLVPCVVLLAIIGIIVIAAVGGVQGKAAEPGNGPPSGLATQLIPANMLTLYQSSIVKQQCPNLSWTVVAAITHLESDDNRNPATSSAGAVGASQFLPTTWDHQGSLSVNVGQPYGEVPSGQGYGVDGDGDGIADINNPLDSVPATARLLCANGGGNSATLAQAIFAYNHAWWYVFGGTSDNGTPFQGVLPLANQLASTYPAPTSVSSAVASGSPSPLQVAVDVIYSQLGKPYVWGGGGVNGPSLGQPTGIDPYQATHTIGFDCSGLMQWAFAKAGILLPRSAAEQYSVGNHVDRSQLQPGDMVFWATNLSDPRTIHHVALYIGNGQIIAAPYTGTVVQIEPMSWKGFIGATRVSS